MKASDNTLPGAGSDAIRLGGLTVWLRRHPLPAFFVLAYAFAWVIWVPLLVLSQNGLGLFAFRVSALPLVILGGFSPGAAALILTALLDGRHGVIQLLRRLAQWRVGFGWYLLSVFTTPLAFLAASILLGTIPPLSVLQNLTLVFTFYPVVLIPQVLLAGGLGEEPGWRGFALPRLQQRFGALPASLILGALHACWHIPLFFVRDMSQAHFNFWLYLLTALAFSVFMTWTYNSTGGSLLLMMLLHESQDTTSALSLRIAPAFLDRTPAYLIVFGATALVILLLTRGRLAYTESGSSPVQSASGGE